MIAFIQSPEPQTSDLAVAFKDSSPVSPLIFVLSQGTDPAADLYKFTEEMKFTKKLSAISLGQGQGPIAEKMMKEGMERGKWIFFQNCHLAPSWMPTLERLIEQIEGDKVCPPNTVWILASSIYRHLITCFAPTRYTGTLDCG